MKEQTRRAVSTLPVLTAALAAVGLISTAHAQVQVAGTLLVDVDATTAPVGTLTAITNNGTLGGFFEARGGGATVPLVARMSGNGSAGIVFDGNDYLQHVAAVGGALIPADATLVGPNPTVTIEAWVLNPGIGREETIVSWGRRGGGPDGSNMSFNYGWDARWGAMGHWGSPDIGWDSCCDNDFNPPGVPKSGVWHHLVYTFDGSVQRVYADGVQKNSETVGLNIHTGTAIMMGRQYNADMSVSVDNPGALTIAKLRVHSEALTGTQVASNYNFDRATIADGGSPLPAGPAHRYSFNNPSGPVTPPLAVTDSIGGAHGSVLGDGATATGSRISLPGGVSATAAYIDLPNGLLSTNSVDRGGSGGVTLEGWVKVTGNRNWARILDFGSTTGGEVTGPGGGNEGLDYLFLSAQEGGNVQRHVVSMRNNDPVQTPAAGSFGPGWDSGNFDRDYHFALTWDEATGEILVYENGERAVSFSAGTNRMSHINDVNVWLGRSNWTSDQNAQAEYDEFRIYKRVLPPDQVRASFTAGADALAVLEPVSISSEPQNQIAPEFGSATFNGLGQGAPPIGYQWRTNGVNVAGATGTSVSFNNLHPSLNGLAVTLVASNNIGGTTYYATSQVATLTVISDTNGPTLVQARMNSSNTVEIVFSESVNATDAATAGNYSIAGFTVTSAVVGGNARRAVLTLDGPLAPYTFYTVSVSNIRDISAAQNPIAAGANTTFWTYSVPGLEHRYTFNTAPSSAASGAAVPDIVGGADGTVRSGTGPVSLTGSRVVLSGGGQAQAPYVDLPNGLLSKHSTNNAGSGKLTFETWYRFTGNQSWQRVMDFGSSGPPPAGPGIEITGPGGGGEGIDYFFYSQVGGTTTRRRVDITNRDQGDPGAGVEYNVLNNNQDVHLVITWDETTGQVMAYENGALVGSFTTIVPMSRINDVNVWLGRSNWVCCDANMQGEIDEFRVYNTVISEADIRRNAAAGADNNFGGLLALDLVATNNMATNTVGSIRLLASFSNAGTQDLAGAASVVYSSTDSNVVFIAQDGTLHAFNTGTATVSATVGGFTDTQVIEVSADSVAPTLVSARALTRTTIEVTFSEPMDPETVSEALFYVVSGPSGPIELLDVEQLGDPRKVVIILSAPMPTEYMTVSVSDVKDQSPLGNTIPPNSEISFLHFKPGGLTHRYTFNNVAGPATNLTTIIPDAAGNGDGELKGSGASFNGFRVVLPGGPSASAAYIDLPNYLLSTNSVVKGGSGKVSFEGWTKVTGIQSWSRILDFGSSGPPPAGPGIEVTGPGGGGEGIDYLFYSAMNASDRFTRRVDVTNRDTGGANGVDYGVNNFNQDIHFVITWDEATGTVNAYENGTLVATFNSPHMGNINDVNVWLGRSNWSCCDANLQGEFDEFRVYDRILTPYERSLNAAIGPDFDFGQPLALRIEMTNFLHSGQSIVPQVFVNFANMSNVNLTVAQVVSIASSAPGVLSNDASGLVHAVASGTANLTFQFSGFTQTIPVIVNGSPTGLDDWMATVPGTAASVGTATLLANDSDVDNDTPLVVASVSATSAYGGTVALGGAMVTYTPAAGFSGVDRFTYVVQDTRGGTDTVTVTVLVPASDSLVIAHVGNVIPIAFRGTPGNTYRIERATSLTPPVSWETISTQVAPASGLITITESGAGGQAFYRAVTP